MIDGEGVVTVKGRAACEIDTADELLTTEMMFNGTFNGLDKHQLVALVSCLVPGEKSQVWACLASTPCLSLHLLLSLTHSITHSPTPSRLECVTIMHIRSFVNKACP